MKSLLLGMVCALLFANADAQNTLPLMPMPASVQRVPGQFIIDSSFTIAVTGVRDPRLLRAAERFLAGLRRQTGMFPLSMNVSDGSAGALVVHADRAGKDVQELGEDESYSLKVNPSGIALNAPTSLGAMHGLQTLLQLVATTPAGFAFPAVTINDAPRFPWRGLMIDVSRHFFPINVLKRNLDGMEAVKLNVFHLHLSDDQGFRVESKKFPKLQGMGSDEFFYTQEEIHDLIAYARDRGIRVVPEFDTPGHAVSWFAGYPELASGHGPYTPERKWGIFDPAIDPTEESTYKFLDHFIAEMAGLFPDEFFHIGGDEVNGKQWAASPKIQAFMLNHGLKDKGDLQAYFNTRVQELVHKHGKTMEGWDEILRPNLPNSIVIQSWRGQESLAGAAKLGYRGLLSSGYYLDLMYPASQHYAVDPTSGAAGNLNADEKKRVLGGEACEWAEYISTENIDSRIWPRMAAIAERLWSPREVTDVASMYERLDIMSFQLEGLGLMHNSYYEPMLRRIAGSGDTKALRTLADVVEPVKEYAREEQAVTPATSLSPLNRLVDAANPESATARKFGLMVDAFLAGKADTQTKTKMRDYLTAWRDNDVKLRPQIAASFLLQEDDSLSRNLSLLGVAGLQAMDYIDHNQRPTADWTAQQAAMMQSAAKPSAQLLLMVAAPVQKLLLAASAGNPSNNPQ
jgi:hexosaminidase